MDVPARGFGAEYTGEMEVCFRQRVEGFETIGINVEDILVAVRAAAGLADARVAIAEGAVRIEFDIAERQDERLRDLDVFHIGKAALIGAAIGGEFERIGGAAG